MKGSDEAPLDLGPILEAVQARLRAEGLEVDLGGGGCCGGPGATRVKVVCVTPGLGESVREMGERPRDQVVMVRVDEPTSRALDEWVATGAVKSRSEAAALFIREGLQVRADELERLHDALRDLEHAQEKLRRRAREVFGDEPEGGEGRGEEPST